MSFEVSSQPSTSAHVTKDKTPERQIQPANSSFSVTPENIIAIPKEVERKIRRRGKTAILTASPCKNDLVNEINKRRKDNKTNDKKKPENKKNQNKKPEKKKAEKKTRETTKMIVPAFIVATYIQSPLKDGLFVACAMAGPIIPTHV